MASVLIIGAGFVGAPFVDVVRKEQSSLPVTIYLRSTRYDDHLLRLGVSIVHGTYEETQKIADLASRHSVVVNAADSENIPLTRAIIEGVSRGKGTILHVSGGGNFFDDGVDGKLILDSKVWDDSNEDDIRLINDEMKNGPCDRLLLEAAARGEIKSFIVCPVGVYGTSSSSFTTSRGVFISGISANAMHLGYSPYLNDGTTVFQLVHIDDVVQLMMLVLDEAIHRASSDQNPYKQYYVAAGEAIEWKVIAAMFAKALHRTGKIVSNQPVRSDFDRAGPAAGFMRGSMKVTDENSRSLGYEPRGATFEEFMEQIVF